MPYLYDQEGRFKVAVVDRQPDLGHLRFTVDTPPICNKPTKFTRLLTTTSRWRNCWRKMRKTRNGSRRLPRCSIKIFMKQTNAPLTRIILERSRATTAPFARFAAKVRRGSSKRSIHLALNQLTISAKAAVLSFRTAAKVRRLTLSFIRRPIAGSTRKALSRPKRTSISRPCGRAIRLPG